MHKQLTNFLTVQIPENVEPIKYQRLCWLALCALIIRIAFAIICENTHRPDEIFQYLEPAHRLAFGYGFISWEFRFGARSWLIPFLISAPLLLCKALHCDSPAIYIPLVKCMLSLLSISLIFSSYVIGKNLVSEKAGWLSALFCALWYELIYFSFRPYSEILCGYFLAAAVASLLSKNNKMAPWIFGLCNGLSLALRLQLFPATIYLFALLAFNFNKKQFLQGLSAFTIIAVLAGFIDYLTWGQWFCSYYNSFLFQWVYHVSDLWGKKEPIYFVKALCIASLGLLPIAFLTSLAFLKRLWMLIVLVALVVLVHSLIPHKDYRYVLGMVPFLLVIAASVIVLLADKLGAGTKTDWRTYFPASCLLAVSLFGLFNKLPAERALYRFSPLYESEDNKLAFLSLSRQSDLKGLCVHANACEWFDSGGYYYLHENVPIYFTYGMRDQQAVSQYLSHELCSAREKNLPGFEPLAHIGKLEIRKQIDVPPQSASPSPSTLRPRYRMDIFQPGIDGVYLPKVHPFLR